MTRAEFTPDRTTAQQQLRRDEFTQLQGLVVELLHTQPDTLALGSFALGAGEAVCVSSYVSIEGYRKKDMFERDGADIIHRRPHNPMIAYADIVGMWNDTTEAALYSVAAPFQPKEEVNAPFAQTIQRIIGSTNRYPLRYESIRSDTFEGHTMSKPVTIDTLPPRVLLTPATTIEQTKYGSLDDADGLDVRLYGPAALAVPQDQYLVVQSTGVLRGPAKNTNFPIVINEADAFSLRLSVAKGGSVSCGEAGELVIPLPYGQSDTLSTEGDFTHNPQIDTTKALDWLVDTPPQLQDVTGDVLGKLREQLLAAIPLDVETSRNLIVTLARRAVQACIAPEQTVQPRLVGAARVSEWITQRIQEGKPGEAADLEEELRYMASPSA